MRRPLKWSRPASGCPRWSFGEGVEAAGLRWIEQLKIDSHRAEMTLLEAARALAAADDRLEVTLDDLRMVAPLALRQRQTDFTGKYFAAQQEEDAKIEAVIKGSKKRSSPRTRVKSSPSVKEIPSPNGQTAQGESPTETAVSPKVET